MKCLLLTAVCIVTIGVLAAPVLAGTLDEVKVGLHLEPHATKNYCTTEAPTEFACDNFSWTSNLIVNGAANVSYDMYIVLMDIPPAHGLLGVEMGIDYDGTPGSGLDPFGVYLCADQEFSGLGWPNSGGAATFTWISCQDSVDPSDPQGEAATIPYAIYVYAYTPDTACIVPKPSTIYGAADCSAAFSDLTIHYPQNSGCAGFGTGGGYHPCWMIYSPVEETTWGAIKKSFD